MPHLIQKRPRRGLFIRVAVLSTLLVILSVGPCAFLFLRQHRDTLIRSLQGQAQNTANSVADAARPNAVPRRAKDGAPAKDDTQTTDDPSRSTLDTYCGSLISEHGTVDHVIVTGIRPSDPANVFSATGSRIDICKPEWFPGVGTHPIRFQETVSPFTGEPVLLCSRQLKTANFTQGWVHVGLSLKNFEQDLAATIRTTSITAVLAGIAGIAGSFFLARRVTRPLEDLCDMAQSIAEGDFESRSSVSSVGEVRHLADHMNSMAEKLETNAAIIQANQRDLEITNDKLRERVEDERLLAKISAAFLQTDTSAPGNTFEDCLEQVAGRLNIDGAAIFLHDTADQSTLVKSWEWRHPAIPVCTIERVPVAGFPWATTLASEQVVVSIDDVNALPPEASAERINLERIGIRSAAAALLGAGDKVSGYLFLRRHASPREWTEREKQFVHLAAGLFSNAIARRDAALERELLHGQLLQAQKMEAVGKLSGGIAHDFNNMLVPIVGYSDSILTNAPADAPWIHEIREIKRSAESAATLTRQLLSFSRKQIVSRKETDINALINKLQHMLRRLIGENIRLQTNLDPELWTTAADSSQIEQCLMNLAVNAKAAMPNGGSIHISTQMIDSEDAEFNPPPLRKLQGLFLKLTVRDTGSGMESGTIARIFEPFFSTKGEEGTGLGLSVVYGVMEDHGGWITVDSTPGEGSTFHLWFPALHEPAPLPMDTGLAITPPLPKGSGQRILLIEDEPGVLAFVSAALRQNGYHILTADSGVTARKVFSEEAETIDLVMSDVVLPDTTGVQLLEEFFLVMPDLKALLTSGYSEKNSLIELVKKRGLFFLHKPYTLIQLLQTVHNALTSTSRVMVT